MTNSDLRLIISPMVCEEVCAVILAGGKSSRMGCNKALMEIGGRPLFQIVIEQANPVARPILISADNPVDYQGSGCPVIPDLYKGYGPLAGIHAAMLWHNAPLYLVLACDLPNIHTRLLANLIAHAEGHDAAIPVSGDGLAHPLCAVYRKTCLEPVKTALQRGNSKVLDAFHNNALRICWISPAMGEFTDEDLANVNTPKDLDALLGGPSLEVP